MHVIFFINSRETSDHNISCSFLFLFLAYLFINSILDLTRVRGTNCCILRLWIHSGMDSDLLLGIATKSASDSKDSFEEYSELIFPKDYSA